MKQGHHNPDIVDFAYQIIALHDENEHLRQELKHYKILDEQSREFIKQSEEHNKEMTGLILAATLDPNSIINRGAEPLKEV